MVGSHLIDKLVTRICRKNIEYIARLLKWIFTGINVQSGASNVMSVHNDRFEDFVIPAGDDHQ